MFFYKINKILQYLSHVFIQNIHLKKLCLETTLEGLLMVYACYILLPNLPLCFEQE